MLLAIPLCIALSACQQGAEITVQQSEGKTRFAIMRVSGNGPACVRTLSVYEGEPRGKPPLWNIVADENAPCTSAIDFPAVPQGFAQDDGTPALRLIAGHRYSVEASGTGWIAFNAFTSR